MGLLKDPVELHKKLKTQLVDLRGDLARLQNRLDQFRQLVLFHCDFHPLRLLFLRQWAEIGSRFNFCLSFFQRDDVWVSRQYRCRLPSLVVQWKWKGGDKIDYCAHICKNGHVRVSAEYLHGKAFCEECGAEMLERCPNCHTLIKEWDFGPIVYLGVPTYDRPAYCKHCGNPYPWTVSALETAKELIAEEESLEEIQRDKMLESLPDIISETPKTQIAVVRFKKVLAKVGSFAADGYANLP